MTSQECTEKFSPAEYAWSMELDRERRSEDLAVETCRLVVRELEEVKSTLSVLLIEDDAEENRSLGRRIARAGMSVICCEDGDSGLRAYEEEKPDLVLLDLGRAGTECLELLSRFRECPTGKDVPILFVTADPSEDLAFAARHRGAADVLHKPISQRRILRHVEEVLSN